MNSANNKGRDGNLGMCGSRGRTDEISGWLAPRCKSVIWGSRVTDATVHICAYNFSKRAVLLATQASIDLTLRTLGWLA